MNKYYSSKTICTRLDIGRSTINKWQKTRGFPEPVRLGNFCNRWVAADVDQWVEQHLANSHSDEKGSAILG